MHGSLKIGFPQAVVEANNMTDKIEVRAGKIEELEIPEKVDVIISEPMGYMLYNERMLETYLHAKKWLKPGGHMYPSRGDLHIAPFTDDSLYMEHFAKANFWSVFIKNRCLFLQLLFLGINKTSME
jgi:type I protein arginine methyltransferase